MRFLKRFVPRLPVCPLCSTVYRYADVMKLALKRKNTCYHCGREFGIKRTKLLFLLAELLILYIVADMLIMNLVTTVAALFVINIVLVILGFLMIPFYIEFCE